MTDADAVPPPHLSTEQFARALARARAARALVDAPTGDNWTDGAAPLTPAQERIWRREQAGGGPAHALPCVVRLRGRLDVAALERSVGAIVARHESLRTAFVERDGRPVRELRDPAPWALPVATIKAQVDPTATDDWALYLRFRVLEEAREPFDLARGPLLRGRLLRIDPNDHLLVLTMHVLAADERSFQIVLDELTRLYPALVEGRAPDLDAAPQFGGFVARQRRWLASDDGARQLAWWTERLAGVEPLWLPLDRARPAIPSAATARVECGVPAATVERLDRLARDERATRFMTLLAGWLALLAHETGQRDIAVGSSVSGRGRPGDHGVVGPCANSLVFRVDLDGDPTFRTILRRVRQVALDAYDHRLAPIDRALAAPGAPIVSAGFAMPGPPDPSRSAGNVIIERLAVAADRAPFDLNAIVEERPGGFSLAIVSAVDRFDRATIAAMLDRFARLLEMAADDPDRRLSGLAALTGAPGGSAIDRDERPTSRPALPATLGTAPRTPTEAAVASVWRAALGVDRVGRDDDFFDLGGHSLLVAEAVARLRADLQLPIQARMLFESPTVAGFARRIDDLRHGGVSAGTPALVALQPAGERRSVFLVPGGAGGGAALFRFAKLARQVGLDRPCFGFFAAPVDADVDPERWLEATAADYVRELRARQPVGPFLLFGGCVGGMLALAMGRRLHAEGEAAPHLILLDTRHPAAKPSGQRSRRGRSGGSSPAGNRLEAPAADDGDEAAASGLDQGLRAPRARLLSRIAPVAYPGRVTLLANSTWLRADPTLGWDGVAAAALAVRALPGQHGTYLRDHTAALADIVRSLLEEIEADAERAAR